jgi:hypothetical protein
MVQILCTHVYEMIPVETIPGMEGAGDKGECWRGNIQECCI